jgi:protein SCO1/2
MCATLLGACSSAPPAPSPSLGTVEDRAVPSSVLHAPLIDQQGRRVSLASWTGRTVLVVPFLTLCAETCPLTTANVTQVAKALRADGAKSKVEIVELSVDPGRDSPRRLAAYSKLTGANWELVTESPAMLARIEHYFGFYSQIVPEGVPADIDWWTHRPLTYDVSHSDGFVVVSPNGHEQFSTAATPKVHGGLNPVLRRFLNAEGRAHLTDPSGPSFTAGQMLGVLAWSLHTPLAGPS